MEIWQDRAGVNGGGVRESNSPCRETERDRERERGRWGLWSVSVFGRYCFGLGRCGSLKRGHVPRCRHFRHSETRRDAHAFLSTQSNIYAVHAHVHTAGFMGVSSNKACFVTSPPHPVYVNFSSRVRLSACTSKRLLQPDK